MIATISIFKILTDLIVLSGKLSPFINLLINLIQFIIKMLRIFDQKIEDRKNERTVRRNEGKNS